MKFSRWLRILLVTVIFTMTTSPVHAATDITSVASLRVISQPFNISGATGTRFVIQIPAAVRATKNATLQIQLHRRIAQRKFFQAIASGEAVSAAIDTINFSLSSIARVSNGYYSIPVPITVSADNGSSLYIPNDGVYPVSVQVLNSDNAIIGKVMTYLNKRQNPRNLEPVQASTLVRLVASPSLDVAGNFVISDNVRELVRTTTEFLRAVDAPLTVAVQPEIIASFSVSPEASDQQLLAALIAQLRKRVVVATTFLPLDTSMLASGRLDDDFIKLLRLGETTLSQLLPNVSVQRNTYIADSYLTDAAIAMLYKAGVAAVILTGKGQEKTTYQTSSSILSQPDKPQLSMSVVSVDKQLSSVISAPEASTTGVEMGYRIAAEMLVQRDDLLASGVSAQSIRLLMSTSVGTPPSHSSLELASNTLAISPGIEMKDFSTPQTVTAQTPVTKFVKAVGIPSPRANALLDLRSEVLSTSSMTKEGDPLRVKWDQLLAAGASTVATDPGAYISGLEASLANARAAITVTTPSQISLSSRDGIIRLQLRNSSTSDLTVKIQLSSVKVKFVDPIRTITLTAGGTTEVQISATTRTNGRFPIALRVFTPEGNQQVLPMVTITARVNALAGFGQAVSAGVLLILLAWWWSHRRKARLEGASETTVS